MTGIVGGVAPTSQSTEEPPSQPVRVLGVEIATIDDARERLLFAGLHVVMTSEADLFIGGIQPDAVVAVAGRSRRNFYDHFESKEAFALALFQRFLLGHPSVTAIDDLEIDIDPTLDFRSVVRSWFTQSALERIEAFGALSGAMMWSSRPGGALGSILKEHNQVFDDRFGARYEAFLHEWDFALASGWTPLHLATVVRCIADGFVMRFRPSRGDFTEEHLDLLVASVVGIFATAVLNNGESAAGRTPAPGENVVHWIGNRVLPARPTAHVTDARRSLRDAFLEALLHQSADEITMPLLATRAGIATSTALRVSCSVKQLACFVLNDFAMSFESALEDDRSAPVSEQAEAHLRRLVRFGFDYAPLIRCWLAFLPLDDREEDDPLDRIIAMLVPLLEEAPNESLRGGFESGQLVPKEAARLISLGFLLPENQPSSPAQTNFSDEVMAGDRKVAAIVALSFEPFVSSE